MDNLIKFSNFLFDDLILFAFYQLHFRSYFYQISFNLSFFFLFSDICQDSTELGNGIQICNRVVAQFLSFSRPH